MKYTAHDYQEYAEAFIVNNPIAAVILEMGLGKTVITLTAIQELMYDRFEVEKVLVVAPPKVAKDTWPREIRKWDHLKGLTMSVAAGTPEERIAALRKKADIYTISRDSLEWLINKSGLDFDFDMVVLDELSSFKSYSSQRFKAMRSVRPKIKRIVGLTGTPASNGLMDLWAEFYLLDMGKRLGRFITHYRRQYFYQIRYMYKPIPGAEEKIYDAISDITISMKAKDHLKMPQLISTEVPVMMDEKERQLYKAMKKNLVIDMEDEKVTASNAGTLSGKLCQMANGAVYADDNSVMEIHSRKLEALEELLEAANGKPVLVAYWFRHDYERITRLLDKLKYSWSKIDTPENITSWNDGKIPVGLIHPAGAGHGLNLQEGGCSMIWYSPIWSLELYQQTVARLWRQGQKANAVVVQHIVTEGTIDMEIMKAIGSKSETQEDLIAAVKAILEDSDEA